MCGIFGCLSVTKKQIDIDTVKKAVESLGHRGPDDKGIAQLENVIIGHIRLSISDLKSNAAKQPVISPLLLLAYNGMIYNFLELKQNLSKNNFF